MKTVPKTPEQVLLQERVDVLRLALSLARERTDNWSLVHRLNQALLDVVCGTVVERTEAMIDQARVLVTP